MSLVCGPYGRDATPTDLVARAEHHHQSDIEEIESFGAEGLSPWREFLQQNLHHSIREMLLWLQTNRELLISR